MHSATSDSVIMKALRIFLLVFVAFSLCACGPKTAETNTGTRSQSTPPKTKVSFRGSDLEGNCLKIIDEHPEEALSLLNQAESDYENDYNFLSLKAVCYAMLGLEDPCLKEIDAAMSLASTEQQRAELFHVQGQLLFESGHFPALQMASEKAVTVLPKDADEWAYLASAYNQQQNFEKGKKAAQTALRLNPSEWARSQASYVLANALGALAKDDSSHREAIVAADTALQCKLNDAPRGLLHLTAGHASIKIRDFASAERHLRVALDAPAVRELAYSQLAEAYFVQKQERSVVVLLSTAVSQYPQNVDFWKKLTVAYARLNDLENTKQAHRRWKQLDPSAPD